MRRRAVALASLVALALVVLGTWVSLNGPAAQPVGTLDVREALRESDAGGLFATIDEVFPVDYQRFVETLRDHAADPEFDRFEAGFAFTSGLVDTYGEGALYASDDDLRAYFETYLDFARSLADQPALCAKFATVGATEFSRDELATIDQTRLATVTAAGFRLMEAGFGAPVTRGPADPATPGLAFARWSAETALAEAPRQAFLEGRADDPGYCAGYLDFFADLGARRDPLSEAMRVTLAGAIFGPAP